MTDFTISITEQAELDGITWAREQHNREAEATARPPAEEGGDPVYEPGMPLTATDNDYVQWVMQAAAKSYAAQKAAAPPPAQPAPEPEPETTP